MNKKNYNFKLAQEMVISTEEGLTDIFQKRSNQIYTKLDNILNLLEEQKSERTHHVTEELILYVFLGFFIIYIIDSFARVGKYVR